MKSLGVGLGLVVVTFALAIGCSAGPDDETEPQETSSAPLRTDCAAVLCAMPLCAVDQVLVTRKGQCCPTCAPAKKVHDCRTSGCASGEHCDVCRTIDGSAYVCLPDGSVC